MKDWILVYFTLCCYPINCKKLIFFLEHIFYLCCTGTASQTCMNGSVNITEVVQIKGYKIGSVFICNGEYWGAVCGDGWDANDTKVLCRELGFSMPKNFTIPPIIADCTEMQAYEESWFGGYGSPPGATNFHCNGTEVNLAACRYQVHSHCSQYAGVMCTSKHYPISQTSAKLYLCLIQPIQPYHSHQVKSVKQCVTTVQGVVQSALHVLHASILLQPPSPSAHQKLMLHLL